MDTRPEQAESPQGIASHLADFFRWLVSISLVTVAIVAAVMYLVHARLDEEIRAHLERKFRASYPNLVVAVGSARRIEGRGIEVRGLSISELDQQGQTQLLAFVDELVVQCDSSLAELVSGNHQVRQIVMRRPKIRMRRLPDGNWNLGQLLPLPKFGDASPPVTVEDGIIEVVASSRPAAASLTLRNVNLSLARLDSATEQDAPPASGNGQLLRIRAEMAGDYCRQASVDAQIDLASSTWTARGAVDGMQASSELIDVLPPELTAQLSDLRSVRGTASLNFQATGQTRVAIPSRLAISGEFTGRIDDARLPKPLTQVQARFQLDERSLHVSAISARAGDTVLRGSCRRGGWQPHSPLSFTLQAEHLVVDRALHDSLPADWQSTWRKFEPEGLVDVQLAAEFDGTDWRHDIALDCRGVDFSYHQFPYRMTAARGRIIIKNDQLKLENFLASASRRPVRIDGQLANPGADFTGWVELESQDPLPLNDDLVAALPNEKIREVIASMNPHGKISVWGRFERQDAGQPVHKRIEIGFQDCSMNYRKFSYPISRIRGTVSMTDDRWEFRDVEGFNDSGFILCSGSWARDPRVGSLLTLNFNATDVPLEDELRDALQPQIQQLWNSIRPRGTIDNLKVAVRYESQPEDLSVEVTARKGAVNVEGRSITIKPLWLPYQWDHVVGTVRFHDGITELQNLRAVHGATEVRLTGVVDRPASDAWRVRLTQIHADRLYASHELTSALPPTLGQAVGKLNLHGPAGMSGWVELAGASGDSRPRTSKWKLDFDIENGNLDCGVPIEHIHGGLMLEGSYDQRGFFSNGRLQIDSLIFKGTQLTNLHGPISIDNARVAFGQWATRSASQVPPQPVFADVFGGSLAGSAQIWLTEQPRFELEGSLQDADLATISQEATSRQLDLSGKTFATVRLQGTHLGMHSLRGVGTAHLREADVYKVPVMIAMLKLLSVKPPDRTAFTSSDIEFRVEGSQIYFDRIDFDGDAVSLEGRGEMNLERAINLRFETAVGRDDNQPLSMLLRPLLKEAGRRLMVIHVTGTLDDPFVRREPFPDLNERIQQVFPVPPVQDPGSVSRRPGVGEFMHRLRPR